MIYSINTETGLGAPLFDGAEGRYIGSPLVSSDRVFAPSADHMLYAVDMNGQLIWKFETEEPLWAKPVSDPDCSCIYLSSMDHKVYAIDAKSGVQIWSTEDLGGSIVGTPSISEDMVLYVGTFANEMVALDAVQGPRSGKTSNISGFGRSGDLAVRSASSGYRRCDKHRQELSGRSGQPQSFRWELLSRR